MHKNAILFAIFLIISACANESETIDSYTIENARINFSDTSDRTVIVIEYITNTDSSFKASYCFYKDTKIYHKRTLSTNPRSFSHENSSEQEFNQAKQIAKAWIAQKNNFSN